MLVLHDRGEALRASPGVAARVSSIAAWAEDGGARVRVESLDAGASRAGRAMSALGRVGGIVPDDADLTVIVALNSPHLVLLGLRAMRRRVLLDVCDSALDTVRVATASRLPLQTAKSMLQVLLVAVAARGAGVPLSYVAEKDRFDDRVLAGRAATAVVPQTVRAPLDGLDDYVGPPQRIVVAADYRAYHNLEGMRMLLDAIRSGAVTLSVPVELYGPVAPAFDLPEGVVYRGWAEEVRDVYRGQTAVFIPNTAAAGVQNKVLEALRARRPVLAGRAVVEGMVDELTVSAYDSAESLLLGLRHLQDREVPLGATWPAPGAAGTALPDVIATVGRRGPRTGARDR